jgi:hypothetical protein
MRGRGLLISGRGHADAGFAIQLTRWLDQLLELPDPLFARLKARIDRTADSPVAVLLHTSVLNAKR